MKISNSFVVLLLVLVLASLVSPSLLAVLRPLKQLRGDYVSPGWHDVFHVVSTSWISPKKLNGLRGPGFKHVSIPLNAYLP